MNDPDAVQRLLRLKRYESPGEEFFAEFAESVKERQRAELLQRSSLSLFAERFGVWCSESFEKRLVLPAAGALALLSIGLPIAWVAISDREDPLELAEVAVADEQQEALTSTAGLDLSTPPVEVIELTIPSPHAPRGPLRDEATAWAQPERATASVPGLQVFPVSAGFGLREL